MTSALRKKLLSLAIRGKLVPQDPADEPASVLLERIRAERESKESAAPRRGRGRRSSSDNPPCPKRGMSSGTAGVEGAVFEPPFPIPESWVWTKLGEIGDTNIGLTYHPQDISDNGIPVLRSNNIQNGNLVLSSLVRVACHILPSQFIKNGDVLICARNGSKALVGKSVLVDSLVEPTSFGAFMAVFRSQFNPFIQLFLQSDEFKQYLNKSNSTTIHQLTQSMLKDAWMPFPSFPEQQRIVKRFEALSALCDAIDIQSVSLSVLAEQAKQKVLDLAIRGLLVSQNPTDEPASTLLDRIRSTADKPPCPNKKSESFESPFPIPDTWEWTTIREINEYERKTLQPDPGSEEIFELYSVPVFESGLPEFVIVFGMLLDIPILDFSLHRSGLSCGQKTSCLVT